MTGSTLWALHSSSVKAKELIGRRFGLGTITGTNHYGFLADVKSELYH